MSLLSSPLNPLLACEAPPLSDAPPAARAALLALHPHASPGWSVSTPACAAWRAGDALLLAFPTPDAATRHRTALRHLGAPDPLAAGGDASSSWLIAQAPPDAPLLAIRWPHLTPAARRETLARLGAALAALHARCRASRHGALDAGGPSFLAWNTLLTRRLDHLRPAVAAAPAGRAQKAAHAALDALRREVRHVHPSVGATLVLRSFQPDLLALPDDAPPALLGALDLSRAELAPGEIDFGPLLWFTCIEGDDGLIDAFYEGYGLARTMDVRRRERVYRALAALDWIAGAARNPHAARLLARYDDACARGLDLAP